MIKLLNPTTNLREIQRMKKNLCNQCNLQTVRKKGARQTACGTCTLRDKQENTQLNYNALGMLVWAIKFKKKKGQMQLL